PPIGPRPPWPAPGPAGAPAAGSVAAGAVAAAPAVEDDVLLSAALAVPFSRAAPRAPPTSVEPTRPALIRAFRSGSIPLPFARGPNRSDRHPELRAVPSAWAWRTLRTRWDPPPGERPAIGPRGGELVEE